MYQCFFGVFVVDFVPVFTHWKLSLLKQETRTALNCFERFPQKKSR